MEREAEWSREWHELFSMSRDGTDLRRHTRCRAVSQSQETADFEFGDVVVIEIPDSNGRQ